MKPRFLLIAQPNSYRIAPYIKAALRMGLEVLIASSGKHSLITEVHAGIHININDIPASLNIILDEAGKKPFAGILGSDDSTVELAARAAAELGLPHNPPEAARISRRKDLARAHLSLAGAAVPIHCLMNLTGSIEKQTAGLPWPCVIKPLNLSASRGVIRVDNEQQFIQACTRIKRIIAHSPDEFERTHVLIEDYIDGIEVAFEGYLHHGKLNTLTIFDKPEPLTGPYFEETIYVTPSRLEGKIQKDIQQTVQQACNIYGLKTGPVHAELRIDRNSKPWLLEVASRTIGGDCARTLDSGNGFNIEELTIALAMDKSFTIDSDKQCRGVMMMPIKKGGILRRIEGLSEARNVTHVENVDIIIREGNELIPLPEGNQYPGYIFAQADSQQKVINALQEAFAKLEFVVAPVYR
ncbi:MAG: ATP-grasp domain-containing protein [Gammaproteobacteria bacterium]|nr:ATP-grasp domain-containing protein [Gammaproteobacteria bacterium]MCW8922159.1 ATP-grasp domain-containing protein [Gammaproteobacteria bacterium]